LPPAACSLDFRRAGRSYREIAQELGVDVHTVHADVGAELAALRDKTAENAEQLRDLELQRADAMMAGLWPQIQAGNPPAVSAGVRVSERRSRLLGLDAPAVTKTELTGSLGVYADRLAIEREQFLFLSIEQMAEIAASEADRQDDGDGERERGPDAAAGERLGVSCGQR
jgi:hypothetical protein